VLWFRQLFSTAKKFSDDERTFFHLVLMLGPDEAMETAGVLRLKCQRSLRALRAAMK
jgi:hypothetical protein